MRSQYSPAGSRVKPERAEGEWLRFEAAPSGFAPTLLHDLVHSFLPRILTLYSLRWYTLMEGRSAAKLTSND